MAVALGSFVGAFFAILLIPVVWLLICMAIPPLRRRPALSYGIATTLAVVAGLLSLLGGGNLVITGSAAVLAVALLIWQGVRAQRKAQAKAGGVQQS